MKEVFSLIAALLVASAPPAAAPDPAEAIGRLTVSTAAYFARIESFVARETISEQVMNEGNGNLEVQRRRTLVTDFQINHLVEDPSALFEFRFVRSIDGKERAGVDEEISRFAFLRHKSASEERVKVFQLAQRESLPGCYWHNLNLIPMILRPEFRSYFEWSVKGDSLEFRQVRGPGIPEDYFDPRSPRHYPTGQIHFSADGRDFATIELQFASDVRRIRMSLSFESPGAGLPVLPKRHEIGTYRPSRTGSVLLTRAVYEYSDYRRFDVTTTEAIPTPGF